VKELPDEKTLSELVEMAKIAAEKAKVMSDLATEIEEKWRRRLEYRRFAAVEESTSVK
jgi:hypothetical protein